MLKKDSKLKFAFTAEGSPNNAMTKKKSVTKENIKGFKNSMAANRPRHKKGLSQHITPKNRSPLNSQTLSRKNSSPL
jgi:hypothetical protein